VRSRNHRRFKAVDARRAVSLLYPIAAFLRAGGLNKDEMLRAFAIAFDRSQRTGLSRRMERIGYFRPHAEAIAKWVRASRFLDSRGEPRSLSLAGPNGFIALVRSTSRRVDPKDVLAVLARYGNVRRTKEGKYELTKPFFNTSGSETMAYEPVASFLSDASSTLGRILRRPKNTVGPQLFWQKADSTSISESVARKFNAFAQQRSLIFLDEMDDWLEAHSSRRRTHKGTHRRIGLGIFSIYSDPESRIQEKSVT
jgi:Family of unknown function (DUF6502)